MAADEQKKKQTGPWGGRSARGVDRWKKRALAPAPKDKDQTELSATIESELFSNRENGFAILRATTENDDSVRLKGSIAHVQIGEHVTCDGVWQNSPEHGWSFQVREVRTSLPSTHMGVIRYLSGNVPKIGEEWAKAIVTSLGDDALLAIQRDAKCLDKVRRPAPAKPALLSATQKRNLIEHMRERGQELLIVQKLARFGIHGKLVEKVREYFGYDLSEVLDHTPYRLVEVRGVGFRTADTLALANGISRTSAERIRAGIIHCLQEAETAGHCFLWEKELDQNVQDALFSDEEKASGDSELLQLVTDQLDDLVRRRQLIFDTHEDERRWWLPVLYHTERRLAANVRLLLEDKSLLDVEAPDRPVSGEFIPNDGQWEAIENALSSRISLITGLPGTGKTTLVKLLLEVIDGLDLKLDSGHERYLLASPTGKAARRLTEASGVQAQTIHRLLQWAPGDGFQRNEDDPLNARFIIVDETSMVDLKLADSLLRAIGPATHLVLVGDADQLPPVGAGKVFDDLIASQRVPSVRLTKIFRQAARSMIVRNAHRIVNGEAPLRNRNSAVEELGIAPEELDDDFFFVHREEPEDVANMIVEFAAERIPKKYGLDPMRDVLVLAPMKKSACGLEVLNSKLQWRLNRDGESIGMKDLRVGDRVIQTRNNYDLEVMNGEVGILASWDPIERIATIDFGDERSVEVPSAQLHTFMLAYAISVHRSQGSQAPAVICAVAMSHYVMLSRSLVNTAITRAQQLCVCVGQMKAMKRAVSTVDSRTRNAALAERVQATTEPGVFAESTFLEAPRQRNLRSEHAEVFGGKA